MGSPPFSFLTSSFLPLFSFAAKPLLPQPLRVSVKLHPVRPTPHSPSQPHHGLALRSHRCPLHTTTRAPGQGCGGEEEEFLFPPTSPASLVRCRPAHLRASTQVKLEVGGKGDGERVGWGKEGPDGEGGREGYRSEMASVTPMRYSPRAEWTGAIIRGSVSLENVRCLRGMLCLSNLCDRLSTYFRSVRM